MKYYLLLNIGLTNKAPAKVTSPKPTTITFPVLVAVLFNEPDTGVNLFLSELFENSAAFLTTSTISETLKFFTTLDKSLDFKDNTVLPLTSVTVAVLFLPKETFKPNVLPASWAKPFIESFVALSSLERSVSLPIKALAQEAGSTLGLKVSFGKNNTATVTDAKGKTVLSLKSSDVSNVVKNFSVSDIVDVVKKAAEFLS